MLYVYLAPEPSMMIFLQYERFHFEPPNFRPGLNWPLIVVAFALALGSTVAAGLALAALRIWLIGPGSP